MGEKENPLLIDSSSVSIISPIPKKVFTSFPKKTGVFGRLNQRQGDPHYAFANGLGQRNAGQNANCNEEGVAENKDAI